VLSAGKHVALARHAICRVGHPSGLTLRTLAGVGRQSIRRCRRGRWPWCRPSAEHAMPSCSPRGGRRGVTGAVASARCPASLPRGTVVSPRMAGCWGRPALWGRSGVAGGRRRVAVRPRAKPGRPGVVILLGREVHDDRATGGLAPPMPPAWVWGPQRPAPAPARRPRAGRQTDEGPPRGRRALPMRPLTMHWSRPPPMAAFTQAWVCTWGRRLTAGVRC